MRVTLPLRALSWASADVDVGRLFTNSDVQKLLYRVTEVCREKVFRPRQVKELEAPKYVLMTEKEVRKAQKIADDRAKLRLMAMPPVMHARQPCEEVITVDSGISGHDQSKFVFTDISFGQNERVSGVPRSVKFRICIVSYYLLRRHI
ncbi:unnamed protein product [Soboliphyme baturini]|uniref:Nop domain-containing protein n=1 Tax=Soboliphyme baturini TaxID=241478 RepID=A0A183J6V6_9BILA|nr:unnamed protein product [Soboliphyme baturini]